MFYNEKELIALIHKHSRIIANSITIVDPNAVPKTLGQAKGDLIVFQSAETPVRLPIGSDNNLLAADSTQATGLAYKQITGTAPIVVSGLAISLNYIAPLTLSTNNLTLNYNTTNLKLTSNQLDTIQNIATTSSPTFNLPNFTGGIKINGATLSDASRKLTAADIISDGYIQAKTKFQGDQNNHFATTIKDITVLPGGFLEYYPFNFRFDQNQLLYCNRRPASDGITIQSSGFADWEIDILFSVYDHAVSLHGKPENSFIEVTTSTNILGDFPTYPFVVLHANNNPVTCKIEVRWSGTGTWNVIYDGTFFNFIMPVNPGGSGYVNGVRWTFSNILNPTYIRWLGWYAPRLRGYGWTVMRGGDTMYGNFVLAAPYKLSIGITNPSEALEVSGNIKSTGWLQGTTAKLTNLTDGYLPYHINDTTGLGNSPIITNGTNVGIGTTTPSYKLDVSGTGRFTSNLFTEGILGVGANTPGDGLELSYQTTYYRIQSYNTKPLAINPIGNNVGIGTTTPSYKLDVSGTGRFTSDLRLDTVLKQLGTSGFNEFNASISHKGNNLAIYSDNFASGWTGAGWRIDRDITISAQTHLELDNLTVRGTMRVYELIINQIRATNGSLFVSSSAKVASIGTFTGDPPQGTLTFEDPEGHNVTPFAVNDILICQRVRLNSTTLVKRIVAQVTALSNTTATVKILDGLPTDIDKGDLFVRIGNATDTTRQGSVYLTSDDSNAPYIDIVDGVNSWTAWGSSDKIKVRLGKLTGITDSFFGTLNGYGLYAKSNAYLRGKIYAEQGGWIAGWTIDSSSLNSPVISANHQIKLIANNTNSIIGVYSLINTGGANPNYLSFGRVQRDATTYGSNYGLAYWTEQGESYFELTNTSKHIAGWQFNTSQLYNGTDIVLDSVNKSISVNADKVKMFYANSSSWGIEGRDSSNNLVFQLGSTNQIAGWNFDNSKLYNRTDIELNAINKKISVSADAVKMYFNNSSDYGIKDSAGKFSLGSTNQIAGWNFDLTKLSNDVVSLEASSSMKGLVVDSDRIKIGKFTTATISNTYTDITTYLLNGYSGINASDAWWASYGQTLHTQSSTSQIYLNKSSNTLYHYVNTDAGQRATDIDELTYGTIHRLFDDVNRVRNRKLKFEFKLRGIKFATGTYHNLYGTVNVIYFNSGFGILKREQILYFQLLESNVPGIGYSNALVIDKTGSNAIEWFIPANIPDLTYLYIEFTAGFLVGGQYRRALDFEVSDLKFNGFEKAKTHINEDGIEIYNSDQNYFRFKGSEFIVNAYDIRIAGYPIPRFLGKYSSAPTTSVQVGDIYINSTDNNIYMCYSFNSATPLWKRINYN